MKTMEVEKIAEILAFDYHEGPTPIINGLMYVYYPRNNDKMYVIDLSDKKIVEIFRLEKDPALTDWWFHYLHVNDEKLYLVQKSGKDRERAVSIVEGQKAKMVCKDVYRDEEESKYVFTMNDWMNGHILNMERKKDGTKSSLDTFDFDTMTWSRQMIKNVWVADQPYSTPTCIQLNDTVYALAWLRIEMVERLEIRVMELKPKLYTICMLDIIEPLVLANQVDIEESKKNLNDDLKRDFDNMITWRQTEEKAFEVSELYRKQLAGFQSELEKMKADGLIEEYLGYSFEDVFARWKYYICTVVE